MDVYCECCVLSGRGFCDELITRPEESYRLWCVVVCNLETSWKTRSWPNRGCCDKYKQISVISYDELLYVRKTAYDNVWTFSGEASEKIWKSSVITAGFLLRFKPSTVTIKYIALPSINWLADAAAVGRMARPICMNLRWQWNGYIAWEGLRILGHCSERLVVSRDGNPGRITETIEDNSRKHLL